jgi:hypothetical protein
MRALVLAPFLSAVLLVGSGCAHLPPPTQARPAPAPVTSSPAAPAAAAQSWELKLGDAAWTALPATLYTFSTGHWECALAGQEDDARQLACTHTTSVTVQTRVHGQAELTLDADPKLLLRVR